MKAFNRQRNELLKNTQKHHGKKSKQKNNLFRIARLLAPFFMLIQNSRCVSQATDLLFFGSHTNEMTGLCTRLAGGGSNPAALLLGGWIRTPTTQFLASDLQGFTQPFGEASRTTLPLNTNSNCRRFSKDTWLYVGARLNWETSTNCGGGSACCLKFKKVFLSDGKKESSACTNTDVAVSEVLGLGHSFTHINQDSQKIGITLTNIVSAIQVFSSYLLADVSTFHNNHIYALAAGEPQIHNVTNFRQWGSSYYKNWIYTTEAEREEEFSRQTWEGYKRDMTKPLPINLGSDVIQAGFFCYSIAMDLHTANGGSTTLNVGNAVGAEIRFRVNPSSPWRDYKVFLEPLASNGGQDFRMKLIANSGANTYTSFIGVHSTGFGTWTQQALSFSFTFCPYLEGSEGVSIAFFARTWQVPSTLDNPVAKFIIPTAAGATYTEDVRPEMTYLPYLSLPAGPNTFQMWPRYLTIFKGGMNSNLINMNEDNFVPSTGGSDLLVAIRIFLGSIKSKHPSVV